MIYVLLFVKDNLIFRENMLENIYTAIMEIIHSDHPLTFILDDIMRFISSLWHYEIFVTADKQPILVSNVIISIVLFLMGLKLAKRLSVSVKKKFSKTLDISTTNSLERISYYCFIILIAIFVLDISNVPLTVFTVIGTTFIGKS